ncbi:MAG: YceI family protein [Kiritimatiellae bacterium]|nr:YceI family protein [Kiritimatiellia bacterium]MCO5061830.1 YceI family protein [Kiritimatiellia bacterium]
MRRVLTATLGLGMAASIATADTYQIDPKHTEIGFAVRHLVISTVRGDFGEFSGTFNYNPDDPAAFSADVTVQTASIDTRVADRNAHLRSPDFFDAEKYPTITFKGTRAEKNGDDLTLYGDLTMRGVTKEIALKASVTGPITDPWGNPRVGIDASATINRQDWGVSWSQTLDSGGLVVSDNVKLEITVEGVKQAAQPAAEEAASADAATDAPAAESAEAAD